MSIIDDIAVYGSMAREILKLRPHSPWTPSKVLEDRARTHGHHTAVAYLDERHTWSEVDEAANRWAHVLRAEGIGPGDIVALMMDNRPEFLFALHGICKIGAATALINTNLSGAPLVHAVTIGKARKLIVGDEHLETALAVLEDLESLDGDRGLLVHAEDAAQARGTAGVLLNEAVASASSKPIPQTHSPKIEDLFCYIYTSGTTGLPKAAVISNFRALGAGGGMAFIMLASRPGDMVYVPLPLYHSSALIIGWCGSLMTGAGIGLRRKFSVSKFWDDIHKFGATRFVYIGELCRYLLNGPKSPRERDHKLEFAVGNGLRPDIWNAFQERFGIPCIREFYGATEGNVIIFNRAGRPGMIGRLRRGQLVVRCDLETGEPILDAEGHCQPISMGETGLLLGKIDRLVGFDGYVDESASKKKILSGVLTADDNYFNTGDLVQIHENDWVSFADRVGDTFRWKGENVSTNEVAEVLNGALGILESNVYGVQVPGADGRAGMAAINVTTEFDLDAFSSFVTEHLPSYQRPLFVRLLVSDMQTTGTFKHQKVRYRNEGFDPSQCEDRLYFLEKEIYKPLDQARFDAMNRGDILPG